MTSTEIQTELLKKLKEYDLICEPCAIAVAEFERYEDMKRTTLSLIMENFNGSETSKENKAYGNTIFTDWIEKKKQARMEALNLQAKKRGLELWIDSLRSLLSFEKTSVGLHT